MVSINTVPQDADFIKELIGNKKISGGFSVGAGLLDINFTSCIYYANGYRYAVPGSTITLTAAGVGTELRYIYGKSDSTIVSLSSATSSLDYVLLAIAEVDTSTITALGSVINTTVNGQLVKNNLTATTAPSSTDDIISNYNIGSLWIDNITETFYICVNASAGAAVWSSGSGGGPVAQFSGTSAVPGANDGLVPDDGVVASGRFFRDDGTWQNIPGGGDLLAANNLSDVVNTATAFTNIKQAATDSTTGVVELATLTEVNLGTDTVRVITPSTLANSDLANDVATNNAKVSNATHSGDVTGATVLTIADDAVTYAKIQNIVANNVLLGNNAGAGGIVSELSAADVRTILNVADGADVSPVASVNGQTGTVILNADDIDDSATTNKFVTASDLTTLSNTSGTNTGDEPQFSGTSGVLGANNGVVPDDGIIASGRFFRDDGTWQTIPGGGDLLAANNLSDVASAATSFNNIKQTATTTVTGVVELATDGEVAAGLAVQANDSRLSDGRNDADAIHVDVAAEISTLTEKATPISGDLLIIEDSADSNNKKKIQIGNLPTPSISTDDLTDIDTTTTALATSHGLIYDGSNFVNVFIPFTISANRSAVSAGNEWLRYGHVSTNLSPIVLAYDCKLIKITAAGRDADSWEAEIFPGSTARTGGTPTDGTELAQIALSSATSGVSSDLNVDFNAGDDIGIFIRGSGIAYPTVTLWFTVRS